MKKSYFICVLAAIAMLVAGCNKDNGNAPESFFSNRERPTWTDPTDYDYTSSMTAVVQVNLKAQYPVQAADFVLDENDVLAAFAGDKCVGVAKPIDGLFYLTVVDAEGAITLRYYSAHYKNLFEAANALIYEKDGHHGSVAEPFAPTFIVVK